ncbi:hypothetical protein ACPCIX_16280 [Streptomyces pseudogriseolus]|jgi:hypothetical protein|uniref:Uncharacterized protein n=3 Tax=Streptomyces TaxID=1883 RepID=M3C1L8_STREZ|nr:MULTISPECIES: hypothetical protein [Streptomyces]EMF30189.1 hypothetical protein H114_05083 [Streptomyces gancidicus BKS 13-15]MCI4143900.1 hypothetical protein [Streptomyces sp. MMS20-AI2-20]GGQ18263.1 hypothetical protein GCM10010233_39080 [Streptomyces gancidicus]GGS36879.1 hypothetical protein GCM10010285_15010 [Streptomyces rubiginosus]
MTITDDVGRLAGGARRTLTRLAVDRLVRPVWYALVAYGGIWLGGVQVDSEGRVVPLVPTGHDDPEPAGRGLRAS